MGVFTAVTEGEARELFGAYDLGAFHAIKGIPAGSVNSNFALTGDRGRFFLRVYEEQDDAGARREAELLARLSERGVSTPAPIVRRDGSAIGVVAGKPAALFPWREGTMRCQASVTEDDARKVGAELAKVHRAGEGIEIGESRFGATELRARVERIAEADDEVLSSQAAGLHAKLDASRRARMDLPSGVVHGDLFRDNVLWSSDGAISALLDFESASRGPYAFDLAVCLLAWCVGDALDPALARAMTAGYQSVRTLEPSEREGLHAEACFAALRFTITRITDYAMKQGHGERVIKDWRRFAMRLATLEAIGSPGLRAMLGV